ncbi:MAG: hypothetical protein Q9217_001891 [Psora testacea]
MGANQSTDSGASNTPGHGRQNSPELKKCYYELLGIERQATEDEIKRAYHRKALDLHPDRNYGNVEATTQHFAEVQSAYEVLSDPQERAWYDSHRAAILRDEESVAVNHYKNDVQVTTAEDILRLFRKLHGQLDFTDSPTGFYATLSDIFNTLASEEQAASEWNGSDPVNYPPFGHASDDYEEAVKQFYDIWTSFATQKSFSWENVYRYSEAPDRRVRRLMEKENKRFREEGIREFNDAVRSLVAFVKKRDPRVKSSQRNDAERQKVLRHAASAQAARSRAAHQAKMAQVDAIPEWMRSSDPPETEMSEDEASAAPREMFECIVCKRNFKSEKQYEAHERSKKHLRAVQLICREMRRHDENFNLGFSTTSSISHSLRAELDGDHHVLDCVPVVDTSKISQQTLYETEAMNEEVELGAGLSKLSLDESLAQSSADSCDSAFDDDYTSREKLEQRISDAKGGAPSSDQGDDELLDLSKRLASDSFVRDEKLRVGKAKEKRAKKAAQMLSASPGTRANLRCAACQAGFPSRTRLFNHIKELGHAQAVPKLFDGRKGKKC